jgi:protocatechuate 3,4-dioxygenase beta subunit
VRRMPAAALLLLASGAVLAADPVQLAPAAEPGTRLRVSVRLQTRDGRPVAGAQVHAYQTDASGAYTRERPMDEPHARLSARLRTDADGRFELRTIHPGGYPRAVKLGGRERHIPAHIHLDIRAPGLPERRLQAVFAEDPLLKDPYWARWVQEQGQPVLTCTRVEGEERASLVLTL